LSPIAWAVVLSIVFYPVYAFICKYIKWHSVAALITIVMILLIIIGPFSFLSLIIVKEIKHISEYLEEGRPDAIQQVLQHPTIKLVIDKMTTWFGITEAELDKAIIENVSKFGKEMAGRITRGIADIVSVALNFIFMTFSIFFILRDGTIFFKKARDYMPFSEEQKDRLASQIRDIIVSTIFGGVIVAIAQGTIGGFAYYILGVPSPALWGFATSIASFIPLIGTVAVWGPAAVYLFIQGETLNGIALSFIGMFGISLIDNILKPIIIGSRTKMPILVIFFSVLGGIKLFGLIGLIIGPLVLAIFVSVVEIFRNIEGGQNA
jgi:predicted PurR-regulated permease PerM